MRLALRGPSTYAHKPKLHQWGNYYTQQLPMHSSSTGQCALVCFSEWHLLTLWCHCGWNGTIGRCLFGGQHLKLLVLLVRRPLDLVVWLWRPLVTYWLKDYYWGFSTSLPTPTMHPHPVSYPSSPLKTGLKLLPTLKNQLKGPKSRLQLSTRLAV